MARRRRRQFSREFKAEAVRLVESSDAPMATAPQLGITRGMLSRWVDAARPAPRERVRELHHSDRGAQYTSDRYPTLLQTYGLRCSMSRPGNCYDNAPVASVFRTLKTELGPQTHASHRQATTAIAAYIEEFYNRERLHSALRYQSPAAFEATRKTAV